eukprot:CAMPEP_0174260228 /NCGR_PEP_ID=MMETSP0439-20130205/9307_1 /TAXON_ID=0 /ORGANISM="Stereomyxa ramosa, Strain Chinc5" /LENGTH=401 /DNA_ID=CAMNT_0015344427 /DNA_START=15 /DNA_END=1220 /DNA_ORIENTATION=+
MKVVLVLASLLVLSLAAELKLASPHGEVIPGEYIVVFRADASVDQLNAHLAANTDLDLLHTFSTVLLGFSAKMTKEQVSAHLANPLVDYVEQNQVMRAIDCTTQTGATWGITRITHENAGVVEDGVFTYDSAADGSGVTAYIIDTGVYIEHNDFGGRATFGFKATSSWNDTDKNGHGTHVASTTAGTTWGIAKSADIVAVKVLGDNGSGSTSGVIAGVDYAASNCKSRGGKCVINMSLGGGFSSALNAAVDNAVDLGVVTAVAAGNDNRDAASYSPASADKVITVGATEQANEGGKQVDARSYFSNYGADLDVFAPGSSITAAWIGSPTAQNTISGTSMASPHVCGVAATILSAGASAATAKDILLSAAKVGLIDLGCPSFGTCSHSPNSMLFLSCPPPSS